MELRKVLDKFATYEAGLSIQEIKDKYNLVSVTKLASNENPLGVSPKVQEALAENLNQVFRYPASHNPQLCRLIAEHFNFKESNVVVGNGSDELIDLLFRVLAEPNKHNAVAFEPCFAMYVSQSMLNGVELRQAKLNADFSFDFQALLSLVDENTRIVFVTNPDNPSGFAVKKQEIIKLLQALPETCLLVVDEAYIDFTDNMQEYTVSDVLSEYMNLAVLRTFSKCYGLAGLRIGYIFLPEYLAEAMQKIRLPFSVNILAEEAAKVALQDKEYYQASKELVLHGRKFLIAELAKLGFITYSSQANFIITKPNKINALDLYNYLLEKGFIIRKLSAYGLNDYLRITVGTHEENTKLIALIQEKMGNHVS